MTIMIIVQKSKATGVHQTVIDCSCPIDEKWIFDLIEDEVKSLKNKIETAITADYLKKNPAK